MAQVQLEIHAPAPLGAGSPCAEHQDSRQLAPGGLQLWEASQDLAAQARDNVSALRQGACVCLCFDRHVHMQRHMTHARHSRKPFPEFFSLLSFCLLCRPQEAYIGWNLSACRMAPRAVQLLRVMFAQRH